MGHPSVYIHGVHRDIELGILLFFYAVLKIVINIIYPVVEGDRKYAK